MADEMVVSIPHTKVGAALGDLEQRLEVGLGSDPLVVVLDMAAVERVSSATVAMLLWARGRCASQGVEILLRHPSRRCRETLERTGLLSVLMIEPPDHSCGVCRLHHETVPQARGGTA